MLGSEKMDFAKRISALELGAAAVVGAALAVYRAYWTGSDGITLAAVGGAAALLLIVLCIFTEGARASKAAAASAPGKGYMTLVAGSGIVLVLSGGLFWLQGGGVFSALTLLKAVFPAACGIAALIRLKHGDGDKLSALLNLFPVFYLCFLLLAFYRANGKVPDVRLYGFETAALVALLLGMYINASVRFEKPRLRRFAALSCLGIAASVMELMMLVLNRQALFQAHVMDWGTAAVMLGFALQLAGSLFYPGERPAQSTAQEAQPTEDQ